MKITPGQRVMVARRAKGWTQEELAEQTNLTIRTIQRLENNENAPRLHTLRTIAQALAVPLESLHAVADETAAVEPLSAEPTELQNQDKQFLYLLNLASFSYLLIPFGHFLVMVYLIHKRPIGTNDYQRLGWQMIRAQIWWSVGTIAAMLLTLLYNLWQASAVKPPLFISYLLPFAGMYLLNGLLIYNQQKRLEMA